MKNELKNLPPLESTKDLSAEAGVPAYVKPRIITYTSEELMEQVGPALTCSGTPCGVR